MYLRGVKDRGGKREGKREEGKRGVYTLEG